MSGHDLAQLVNLGQFRAGLAVRGVSLVSPYTCWEGVGSLWLPLWLPPGSSCAGSLGDGHGLMGLLRVYPARVCRTSLGTAGLASDWEERGQKCIF